MDRVFLDANVLVSAALEPDARLRALWELAEVRLLASPHVVEEARRDCRKRGLSIDGVILRTSVG